MSWDKLSRAHGGSSDGPASLSSHSQIIIIIQNTQLTLCPQDSHLSKGYVQSRGRGQTPGPLTVKLQSWKWVVGDAVWSVLPCFSAFDSLRWVSSFWSLLGPSNGGRKEKGSQKVLPARSCLELEATSKHQMGNILACPPPKKKRCRLVLEERGPWEI